MREPFETCWCYDLPSSDPREEVLNFWDTIDRATELQRINGPGIVELSVDGEPVAVGTVEFIVAIARLYYDSNTGLRRFL